MSMEKNWAEARKTAANLENFFSSLGSAKEVFDKVLDAERKYADVLGWIEQSHKELSVARGLEERAGKDAAAAITRSAAAIEVHEAGVEIARQTALNQQSANRERLAAEDAEEVRKVSEVVHQLEVTVSVQTENRDNLTKEIGQLTTMRDELVADLDAIKERIG